MIHCLVKGKHITVCLRGIFLQLAPKKLYCEIDRLTLDELHCSDYLYTSRWHIKVI